MSYGLSKVKRIAILGGTFNPIHTGHLAMAKACMKSLQLTQVIFVPSSLPPHKSDKQLASSKDRYQMVKLAIKGCPKFLVSDFEIKKGGRSYSINTVKYFLTKLNAKDQLLFIIGQDSLNTLSKWKNIGQLVKLVQFVVVNRPGVRIKKSKYNILTVQMPDVDVSSSEIRKNIAKGKTVRKYLPGNVVRYIEKKQLYK